MSEFPVFFCFTSAYRYPFYAVQWHPEKSPFEWIDKPGMVHTSSAVRASFYTASFFVSEGNKQHVCVIRSVFLMSKLKEMSEVRAF